MLNSHSLPRERKFEATNRISMALAFLLVQCNYRNLCKIMQDLTNFSLYLARNMLLLTYGVIELKYSGKLSYRRMLW